MLTLVQVKQEKPKEKSSKFADGKGLYLDIMTKGQKYWRYDYHFAGKCKTLALEWFENKESEWSDSHY